MVMSDVGLLARDVLRIGGDLPAEGHRFRRFVHRGIRTFGRRCGATIHQMQLVMLVLTIDIVADLGSVRRPNALLLPIGRPAATAVALSNCSGEA